nr:LuxR C-terminal-related transcriptional regulator [Rhodococcus sp. (in: high G+C Gram-positive bacteria)]
MTQSKTARVGNVGAELTSFVGRRREAMEVSRLLSMARLVTLTGPGGVGKTRLAFRVAVDRARDFRDGVWCVALAPLEDESVLAQTVASALGLQERGGAWPVSVLAKYLKDKELLLVLDNCEHLKDSCAVLIDALLREAPELRVLATSRQAVGLTGEHVLLVPPLSMPESKTAVGLDSILHYEAVSLFIERARAVRPTFELTDDNVAAVAALCRRLDGIPLAIELAAARMRALSVNDLLERLEDRFELLTGGSKAVLPRHQTLRELVDWSWDLCSDDERTLWARASIFPAGFDLASVEAVCAEGALKEQSVLDALTGLVEKTVVTMHDEEGVLGVRYGMLETLKQYGRAKLVQSGAQADAEEAHRVYFRRMAGDATENWFSPKQRDWLNRIRLEYSNIRLALDTSFDHPELVDAGLEMVIDLWECWFAMGRTSEARLWLDRGLGSSALSARSRMTALGRIAYLSVIQRDLAAARAALAELESMPDLEDGYRDKGWTRAYVLALVRMGEGDLMAAEQPLEEVYAAHAADATVQWAQDVRFCLAIIKSIQGDLEGAEAIGQQSLRVADSHGELSSKGYILWYLGIAAFQTGQPDRAAERAREALRLGEQLDFLPFIAASCFELLGWVASDRGEPEKAARLIGTADAIWEKTGPFFLMIRQLTGYHDECMAKLEASLGEQHLAQGLRDGAQRPWAESIVEALGEVSSPVARVKTTSTLGPLTKRESEVAGLVAEGGTNKEIAARLVIAPRTAEAHLERIMTKLGFTSRSQVAAWVAERRRPAER